MICNFVIKFKNKIKKMLESNKFQKLNEFHFRLINDYSNIVQINNENQIPK